MRSCTTTPQPASQRLPLLSGPIGVPSGPDCRKGFPSGVPSGFPSGVPSGVPSVTLSDPSGSSAAASRATRAARILGVLRGQRPNLLDDLGDLTAVRPECLLSLDLLDDLPGSAAVLVVPLDHAAPRLDYKQATWPRRPPDKVSAMASEAWSTPLEHNPWLRFGLG